MNQSSVERLHALGNLANRLGQMQKALRRIEIALREAAILGSFLAACLLPDFGLSDGDHPRFLDGASASPWRPHAPLSMTRNRPSLR